MITITTQVFSFQFELLIYVDSDPVPALLVKLINDCSPVIPVLMFYMRRTAFKCILLLSS